MNCLWLKPSGKINRTQLDQSGLLLWLLFCLFLLLFLAVYDSAAPFQSTIESIEMDKRLFEKRNEKKTNPSTRLHLELNNQLSTNDHAHENVTKWDLLYWINQMLSMLDVHKKTMKQNIHITVNRDTVNYNVIDHWFDNCHSTKFVFVDFGFVLNLSVWSRVLITDTHTHTSIQLNGNQLVISVTALKHNKELELANFHDATNILSFCLTTN